MKELPYCSDCGDARVPHAINKFNLAVDVFLSPLMRATNAFSSWWIRRLRFLHLEKIALSFFNFLAFLRIGTIGNKFREGDSIRTKALFDGASSRNITLYHFRFFDHHQDGVFIAKKGNRTIVFDVMPRPHWWKSKSLEWMDDKGILKEKMQAVGVPAARGGVAHSQISALDAAHLGEAPWIAKPTLGTRGRHTTLGLMNDADVVRGFQIANQIAPYVLIEEELQGIIYRVTLIGGKVAGVVKRDPPQVKGDGIHTVQELIDIDNKDPRRDSLRFYPLQKNERMDAQLAREGYTKDSIPPKDAKVIINDKISRIHGTVTFDVTNETHPDIIELFEGPFISAIDDALVGVDFMIGDISKSWKEQPRCGIVECNAVPYIDLHHYPFEGEPRNVAGRLWDLVFEER